jgi:hypothetical protein
MRSTVPRHFQNLKSSFFMLLMKLTRRSITLTGTVTKEVLTRRTSPSPTSSGPAETDGSAEFGSPELVPEEEFIAPPRVGGPGLDPRWLPIKTGGSSGEWVASFVCASAGG